MLLQLKVHRLQLKVHWLQLKVRPVRPWVPHGAAAEAAAAEAAAGAAAAGGHWSRQGAVWTTMVAHEAAAAVRCVLLTKARLAMMGRRASSPPPSRCVVAGLAVLAPPPIRNDRAASHALCRFRAACHVHRRQRRQKEPQPDRHVHRCPSAHPGRSCARCRHRRCQALGNRPSRDHPHGDHRSRGDRSRGNPPYEGSRAQEVEIATRASGRRVVACCCRSADTDMSAAALALHP